jgi:hypothetical protein
MEEAKKLVEKIAKFNNVDIEEVLPLLTRFPPLMFKLKL